MLLSVYNVPSSKIKNQPGSVFTFLIWCRELLRVASVFFSWFSNEEKHLHIETHTRVG